MQMASRQALDTVLGKALDLLGLSTIHKVSKAKLTKHIQSPSEDKAVGRKGHRVLPTTGDLIYPHPMQDSLDRRRSRLLDRFVLLADNTLAELPKAISAPTVHYSVVVEADAVEETTFDHFKLSSTQIFWRKDKRLFITLTTQSVPVLTKHECVDTRLSPLSLRHNIREIFLYQCLDLLVQVEFPLDLCLNIVEFEIFRCVYNLLAEKLLNLVFRFVSLLSDFLELISVENTLKIFNKILLPFLETVVFRTHFHRTFRYLLFSSLDIWRRLNFNLNKGTFIRILQ